jgi:hypothetical protein
MDITSVIKSFSAKTPLTITIGKSISRGCFSINNKIFFDVLKTYLNKNGWFVSKQYLSKRFYYNNKYLESTITDKRSILIGLDVPVNHKTVLYEKSGEVIKRFRGTYFDIFCHQYSKSEIDNSEFNENSSCIFSEVGEEISVFKKAGCNLDIVFSVNKEKEPIIFSIRLEISALDETELDQINIVFEIIELAMCKYKKTEKTVNSVFQSA